MELLAAYGCNVQKRNRLVMGRARRSRASFCSSGMSTRISTVIPRLSLNASEVADSDAVRRRRPRIARCYAVTRCRTPGDADTTRYTAMAAAIPAITSLFRAMVVSLYASTNLSGDRPPATRW